MPQNVVLLLRLLSSSSAGIVIYWCKPIFTSNYHKPTDTVNQVRFVTPGGLVGNPSLEKRTYMKNEAN